MRILILNYERVVIEALTALVETMGNDFTVVGGSDSGLEGVELARRLTPDVVLSGMKLRELNGVDTTRRIMDEVPDTKVLILASDPKSEPLTEALEAGALGYITRHSEAAELETAVRTVYSGKVYLCPESASVLVETKVLAEDSEEEADVVFSVLTPREREVLQLLAEGNGSKEVADRLNISPKTVDTHRSNIMQKLETDSLADLVKHAIRAGLTDLKI
ncbi:MAG: response regulator transcription factor [Candidatus Eisenbacteria bacterium]|uniref:Response regulator transcription factor n=1 Tax=Eiseniibacteriota bacterium TaxID=2212470 RepID=A0A7Y2EB76_UNCEI|nr:response regulator transcription factor [Candidatus Eisenbacteria bacterium]